MGGRGMESYEVLKKAMGKIGVKSIASGMGLSPSLVYKWCQRSDDAGASGADIPLDRVIAICNLAEDTSSIAWLCQKAGGFFVKNPQQEECGEKECLHATQKILKEFSELLEEVSKSTADDGTIDKGEAVRIRKEWEDLKAVAEGFVAACERGLFRSRHSHRSLEG